MTTRLCILDVNETLSDLSPLRKRFTDGLSALAAELLRA